jgi:electron transport complex protein RnfC
MMAGMLINPATETITGHTEALALRPPPRAEKPAACIECGWCVDHCPTQLNPVGLYDLARSAADAHAALASEAEFCIGCGLCSYVCPTRLPLTRTIIDLRQRLRTPPSPMPRPHPPEAAG